MTDVTDGTHECPKPGCEKRLPFDVLACPPHWFEITATTRARLWREWRNHPGEDSYFEARAQCLLELGVPIDQVADLNGGVGVTGATT